MTTEFGPYALPSENGFRTVLAVGAGAALLGFAVASFIPRQRAGAPDEPVAAAEEETEVPASKGRRARP